MNLLRAIRKFLQQIYFLQATVITCGHVYCEACIYKWANKKAECPTCSKKISSYESQREVLNIVEAFKSAVQADLGSKDECTVDEQDKKDDQQPCCSKTLRKQSASKPTVKESSVSLSGSDEDYIVETTSSDNSSSSSSLESESSEDEF